jgi:hypothetical protein
MNKDGDTNGADPFASLSEISERPPLPRPDPDVIRTNADANGFPSRAARVGGRPIPKARQWERTSRVAQLNVRISAEALARFTEIAYQNRMIFADVLDLLMDAYDASERPKRS